MIDWLSFRVRLSHADPIHGGQVVSFDRDGNVEWQSDKLLPVVGSHDSRIMVRSCLIEHFPGLEISGNPVKFFQGHNVFGTSDLRGLARAILDEVVARFSLEPDSSDVHGWDLGAIWLTRVDVTESYSLGNRHRVRTAIRALSQQSYLTHRGRPSMAKEGTVYWGKNSRRWALKAYAKGDELEALKHQLPAELRSGPIPGFADDLLRIELVLRSMELKKQGLDTVLGWDKTSPEAVHSRHLMGLQISDSAVLNSDTLSGLPPRLQLAYNAWHEGHDLRQMLPRRTFYRYRLQLIEHGVDIAVVQPRENPSNVVPLKVVLHARPVSVPTWAIDTPLYFQPRPALAA